MEVDAKDAVECKSVAEHCRAKLPNPTFFGISQSFGFSNDTSMKRLMRIRQILELEFNYSCREEGEKIFWDEIFFSTEKFLFSVGW